MQILLRMRTRRMVSTEEKFEKLKEHMKQRFCDYTKRLQETCENFFEKFRTQFKENLANELNKRD